MGHISNYEQVNISLAWDIHVSTGYISFGLGLSSPSYIRIEGNVLCIVYILHI